MQTLTRTVTTEHGIYSAGLAVRVVSRAASTATVDVAPPGYPARLVTIPTGHVDSYRPARTTPDVCGTMTGVNQHKRKHEYLCPACCTANADYARSRSVIAVRNRSITIPIPDVAVLYEHTSPAGRAHMSTVIGPLTMAAIMSLPPLGDGTAVTVTGDEQ